MPQPRRPRPFDQASKVVGDYYTIYALFWEHLSRPENQRPAYTLQELAALLRSSEQRRDPPDEVSDPEA
jgi:hypothetical protein